MSQASNSQDSSVNNWTGYAQGGYRKHDNHLREKLREMDRLAEQKPNLLRDDFLNSQTEQFASPTLRAINLPPPAKASTMSTSPAKGSNNNLFSWADVTRGSRITNTNRTSEPLTGYTPAAPKPTGQQRMPAQKPVHPQHPVAPQHSEAKPSRSKPRGLENTIKRMVGRNSMSQNVNKKPAEPAEPVDESDDLLIDFS